MEINQVTEIELNDGSKVSVKTALTIATIKKYMHDGVLPKDFFNKLTSGSVDTSDIDVEMLINVAFVCYKQAGGKMDKEAFEESLVFDMEDFVMIFMNVILGGQRNPNSQFKKELKRNTKK